jgi:hypothetical protein
MAYVVDSVTAMLLSHVAIGIRGVVILVVVRFAVLAFVVVLAVLIVVTVRLAVLAFVVVLATLAVVLAVHVVARHAILIVVRLVLLALVVARLLIIGAGRLLRILLLLGILLLIGVGPRIRLVVAAGVRLLHLIVRLGMRRRFRVGWDHGAGLRFLIVVRCRRSHHGRRGRGDDQAGNDVDKQGRETGKHDEKQD